MASDGGGFGAYTGRAVAPLGQKIEAVLFLRARLLRDLRPCCVEYVFVFSIWLAYSVACVE